MYRPSEIQRGFLKEARGAVLVEAAFAVPLFLIVVLASIGWGYFFTKQVILNYAVHFSARCATIQGNSSGLDYCGIYNITEGSYQNYGSRTSMGMELPASFQAIFLTANNNHYVCVNAAPTNALGVLGGISLPAGQASVPLAIPLANRESYCTSTQ